MRNSFGVVARIAALVLFACAALANASTTVDQEHQVKAALIANFIKFIDWPTLGDPGSRFIVGVYGADTFEHTIEDTLNGRSLSGHPIVVQQIHSDAEMKKCRVVVSGASSEDRIEQLAKICSGSSTVLIGESDDFVKYGGCIGFRLYASQVQFNINLEAAKRSRVTVSSNLSALAHEVIREGGP
jgi:hypothetical protein